MSLVLKENLLGLTLAPAWVHPWKGVGEPLPEATIYACNYWINHVSDVADTDEHHAVIIQLVGAFLKKRLLHWIEAMSILGQSRSCITLLGQLLQCIPVIDFLLHLTT